MGTFQRGGMFFLKLRAPDDGMGDGGGGSDPAPVDAPQADAAPAADATTPAAAPAEASAGAPPSARSDFDFQRAYVEQAQYLRQLGGMMQEQQRRYEQEMGGIRDVVTRVFLPKEYEAQRQPKSYTYEDAMRFQQQMEQKFEQRMIAERIRDELPRIKNEFPTLTRYYGEDAEDVVAAAWINSRQKFRTLTEAAKYLSAKLEAGEKATLAAKQAEWAKQKEGQAAELRGASGPRGSGSAPRPGGEGVKSKGQGRERFTSLDIDAYLKDTLQ